MMRRWRKAVALGLLVPWSAWAFNPLEKNHPLVDQGIALEQEGKFEEALQKYEAARPDVPNSAALEFNKAHALQKLGRNDDALASLKRALELDKGPLRSKIQTNLGTVYSALKQKEAAIDAYRKALRLDPHDAIARHNLELLLQDEPPPQSQPDGGTSDGGTPDGGRSDAGQRDGGTDGGQDGGKPDGGADGGRGDGGAADGGNSGGSKGQGDGGQDGGKADGGSSGGQSENGKDGGQSDREQTKKGDAGSAGRDGGDSDEANEAHRLEMMDGGSSMSKKEAEQLLNSLRNSEKNLQLWRFQQKKPKKPNEKDW